jgi:hypothetical protein
MNLLPNLSGSRIGFYVPSMRLGGSGDLASAVKLSRQLRQHGAEITVYTDAREFDSFAPLLETEGGTSVHNVYVDGARGPIACTSLVVDSVEWVAASREMRRSSFGWHNTDLLVCVHDVPGRPDLVSCPGLLVHEYGDHDCRWGHLFNRNHTLDYRTGLIVEKRHPGDVAGGVYLARRPAGPSEGISATISGASSNTVVNRIRSLVRGNDMTGAEIRGLDAALSELKDILERSAHISIHYVGKRTGSAEFVSSWCRARATDSAEIPVMFVLRKKSAELVGELGKCGISIRSFIVGQGNVFSSERIGVGAPKVCLVFLERGLPQQGFGELLAIANDVSLLTGDHSISEALEVGNVRAPLGPSILPLLYVGYYEKAEDYAQFLSEFDPLLARVYLKWVIGKVDGTGTRTHLGEQKRKKLMGGSDVLGIDYFFGTDGMAALRRAVIWFPSWLAESRRGLVAGNDAAYVGRSFARVVAHLLGGHNVDDLRVM